MAALAGVGLIAFGSAAISWGRQPQPVNRMVRLLADDQAVFGTFSGDKTAEQGAKMAANELTDFVFYSMETGPFDLPGMQVYMRAMREASGDAGPHPIALRIPPIRDGRELARERIHQAIEAGVDAIVFPHVETADEAAFAVGAIEEVATVWPRSPSGSLVNVVLIEDQVGVASAREIVSTPGVSVVIPGPGDLRRAYDGDADAVEDAIQTVLAACEEFDVPCGITAGPDDIGERLEQGFRFFVVTDPAALAVGRRATGRNAHENAVLDLWASGTPAFGVFVPNERPRGAAGRRGTAGRGGSGEGPLYTREGGERLAQNPLYDYVFLNLEGGYDSDAVAAIAAGLRSPTAVGRKTLLVRIPPIDRDGADAARNRVEESLELGADGIVFPHVRDPEQVALAAGFLAASGADVWSPDNPGGEKIAMIMIEDPGALARVAEIAETPGISILACGIGSLSRALDGDRQAAEAGNQRVLAEARRIGVADMITAGAGDIEQRIAQGFLALLMQGPDADDVIRIGRAAVGRR